MKLASAIIPLSLTLSALLAHAADKWDISKLDTSKLPAAADKKGLTYANDIKPLFKTSCLRCHGEERPKGELRLDSLEAVLKGGKDGKVIIPGESKKSLLLAAAAQLDDEIAMPPKRGPGRGGPGGGGHPKGAPAQPPPGGSGGDNPPPGGSDHPKGPEGSARPSGPGGFGGRGGFGPPAKPLTSDQVALIRAWIDQGAK